MDKPKKWSVLQWLRTGESEAAEGQEMTPEKQAQVDRSKLVAASLEADSAMSRLQAAMQVRMWLPSAIEPDVPAEEIVQRLVAVNDAARKEIEAYNGFVAAMKAYFDAGHVASRSTWDALRKDAK